MKLSLITRVFAGYFLLFVLLAGVILYSVTTMRRMEAEQTLVRSTLMPLSAGIQELALRLSQLAALLDNGSCEELVWADHELKELRPFEELDLLAVRLEELAAEERLSPAGRAVVARLAVTAATVDQDRRLLVPLQMVLSGDQARPATVLRNRELLAGQVRRYLEFPQPARDVVADGTAEAVNAERTEARVLLGRAFLALSREVRELEASFKLAISSSWGENREEQSGALRVVLLLGGVALAITVGVLFLLWLWLKPLDELRTLARRIAGGDYAPIPPIGGGDEIGALAQELNTMAGRLREREEMIRRQAGELLRADRFSTIGKMSTQIAHEIRNPLNALGLKLELLEECVEEIGEGLPAEVSERLQRAIETSGKEIDRLREITEYYLKFAKFPKVEKEPLDLHALLNDTLSFYEEEARLAGIRVERSIGRPLRARADANLLRHALANLLKNAIEATAANPPGTAVIQVQAQAEAQRVRISVQDNGPGIPAGEVDRVFEPFFSTKKSGTGLGLTLVQQVVSEHGGTVSCSSTPGEGTVFRISLPE